MDNIIAAQVSIILDDMSNAEILAHVLGVQLGNRAPHHLLGWDKISPLYTEDNKTQMHNVTQGVFMALAQERLGLA